MAIYASRCVLLATLLFCLALSGCLQNDNPVPLEENERGPNSVIVTIDFGIHTNLSSSSLIPSNSTITNITFDPVLVSNGTNAYRVMEEIQIREAFTMDVTFYSFGPFITAIDGVSQNTTFFWILYENEIGSCVGANELLIESDTSLMWKLQSDYPECPLA